MIDYQITDDVLRVEIPGVKDTQSSLVGYKCGQILFNLVRNNEIITSDFMWIENTSEEGAAMLSI